MEWFAAFIAGVCLGALGGALAVFGYYRHRTWFGEVERSPGMVVVHINLSTTEGGQS